MKTKYQKGGRLTKRRDKLTGKLDTLKGGVGTKFVRGKTGPTDMPGIRWAESKEVPDYTKKSQKRKSKNLTKRIDKLGNRINKEANKNKHSTTPLNKKSLNAFLQKGGALKPLKKKPTSSTEQLRTATSSPVIYNTAGGGKGMYKSGSKYVNDKPKRGYYDAYESQMSGPRSRGRKLKTKQKGGKVKTSLQYNPNYPTTQNKPSPHSKLKLDKAIARDSTSIANRGPIGDFFDDGTETSTSRKLQVNREYRDKVNNADSKATAKKINKMKSKKQMGGSVAERMRNAKGPTPPKKMTGQETKDLGQKKLTAGRANRRTARGIDGGAKSIVKSIARGQRQEGRSLKSKGRKMKRSDRQDKKEAEVERTRSWLQTGGSKEVVFGAPKKQKGGERDRFPDRPGIQSNTSLDLGYKSVAEMKAYVKAGANPTLSKNNVMELIHEKVKNQKSKKKLSKIKVNERYNKGAMQKGGARNKKFLGGLMGAVGGMKGAEGGIGKKLMGAAKGALGGGMLGRVAGGIKGAMGGGGLKGAMAGIKGGAFGNSNPMAQQQGAEQAQGADPAMAAEAAAAQMAQRGGMRDRRRSKKAGKDYKKNNRQRKKGSGKIYGNKNSNCYKGDC